MAGMWRWGQRQSRAMGLDGAVHALPGGPAAQAKQPRCFQLLWAAPWPGSILGREQF